MKDLDINAHTKIFCLIGHPVEHSMSPTMWNPALRDLGLNYIYIACDVHPDDLENAIKGFKALNIKGMNVTIPHKEEVIKFLDEIEPMAQKIGAVNTIKNEDGRLIGRNTDAGGAKKSLLDAGCNLKGKRVLCLGAGGVSRALCFTLSDEVDKIILTDLYEERAQTLAKEIKTKTNIDIEAKISDETTIKNEIKIADILVNATPIGMFPKVDQSPVPSELLHENLFVFDVVYNPLETKLMKDAKKKGCNILGGLDMLVNQGVLAFEWWTGKSPDSKLMKDKIIQFLGLN